MTDVFNKSDSDRSGTLSLVEFQKCCRDADIGLTRKEVNVLMHQCDVDQDGTISYQEFVPLCFELLVEIMKDELLLEKRSPNELEEFLVAVWGEADATGDGFLDPISLRDLLKQADLGLTRLQIHTVLSEAEFNDDGMADFAKFAVKAAGLIYRMLDMDVQIERAEAVQNFLASGADFQLVHGCTQPQVELALMAAFMEADTIQSGFLEFSKCRGMLTNCSLGLSTKEVMTLLSCASIDADRNVEYGSLAAYGFIVLQHLAQEAEFS